MPSLVVGVSLGGSGWVVIVDGFDVDSVSGPHLQDVTLGIYIHLAFWHTVL